MRRLVLLLFVFSLFAVSCGSAEPSGKKDSVVEQKVNIIKKEHKNRTLEVLAALCRMKKENGDKMNPFIREYVAVLEKLPKHPLAALLDSPNKAVKIAPSVARIHLRNNYPSGTTMVFIKKGRSVVKKFMFPFNTEKKVELAPGTYEITFFIDRKFNKNLYAFTGSVTLRGGQVYVGEFNITSQYNKSGSCPAGTVSDDDVCMKQAFGVVDNCDDGYHLVEHLCCEEGYNFIMEGHCSQYSDKVEHVVCPKGYEPGGKGRCCPKGEKFIDGACRKPEANTAATPAAE